MTLDRTTRRGRWGGHPDRPGQITTPEEWWRTFDCAWGWGHLQVILWHHLLGGEPAHDVPGNDSSAPTGRTISGEVHHLVEVGDHHRLLRYLHVVWALASDAYAWSVPHWGLFCDLLSEDWVFEDVRST